MRLPRLVPVFCALAAQACGANQSHPSTTHDPYRAGAEEPLSCVPNVDGKIDSTEMAPSFEAVAHYLVSPAGAEQPVDLAGRIDQAGHRVWDWSADVASDQIAALTASPIAGKWYANRFPSDAFVSSIDAGKTTDGIYRHSPTSLALLGVASAEERPAVGQTLMVYEAPVDLYRFPLAPGGNWTSVGVTRNGMFRGLPYAGRDTYVVKVDGAGDLVLPDLEFTQALRVRMLVTVAPAVGVTVVRRQVSYVSECFGEVARATSQYGESEEDFTTAAEVRRLGL